LFLESTNNPLFVRMTGSGSTIVAYYNSLKSCKLAKAKFKRKYKNYWCVTAKTI
jgi:4-diphosphocytidyl-2-C-methyl-D-erythritol kinase